MIPMSAMRYYTDPTVPAAGDTEYGYIIDSIRPAQVGTFAKMKKTVHRDAGRLVSVTTEGYYADAVPVNRLALGHSNLMVGVFGAPDAEHARFGVGHLRTFFSGGTAQATQVRFSDGTQTAETDPGPGMRAAFKAWMPAAPWALELMPAPGDTPEVVDAKVEVARLRWTELHRLTRLEAEGRDRDSEEDLGSLRSEHPWIPEFRYSPLVTATVMVAEQDTTLAVPETLQSRVRAMQEAGLPVTQMRDRVTRSIPVTAVFTLPHVAEGWDDIKTPPVRDVRDEARQILGDNNLAVSDFHSTWFLNSTAPAAG